MKKIAIVIIMMLSVCSIYGYSVEEIKMLNKNFSKSETEIDQMLKENESKIKNDGKGTNEILNQALLYMILAIKDENNKELSGKAKENINKIIEKYKDEPLVLSYAGMIYSLVVRDEKNGLVKMFEANKCAEFLDRAVKIAKNKQEEIFIRFYRGNTLIKFPDFFGKKGIAEEDLRYVLEKLDKGENNSIELYPEVLFALGNIEISRGNKKNAVQYYKRAVEIDNINTFNSSGADQAKKQLHSMGEQ